MSQRDLFLHFVIQFTLFYGRHHPPEFTDPILDEAMTFPAERLAAAFTLEQTSTHALNFVMFWLRRGLKPSWVPQRLRGG